MALIMGILALFATGISVWAGAMVITALRLEFEKKLGIFGKLGSEAIEKVLQDIDLYIALGVGGVVFSLAVVVLGALAIRAKGAVCGGLIVLFAIAGVVVSGMQVMTGISGFLIGVAALAAIFMGLAGLGGWIAAPSTPEKEEIAH